MKGGGFAFLFMNALRFINKWFRLWCVAKPWIMFLSDGSFARRQQEQLAFGGLLVLDHYLNRTVFLLLFIKFYKQSGMQQQSLWLLNNSLMSLHVEPSGKRRAKGDFEEGVSKPLLIVLLWSSSGKVHHLVTFDCFASVFMLTLSP